MAAIPNAEATLTPSIKRVREGEKVTFTLVTADNETADFDADGGDVIVTLPETTGSDRVMSAPVPVISAEEEAPDAANGGKVFKFDVTFSYINSGEISYVVTVLAAGVTGVSANLTVTITVFENRQMTFFSDVLDGYTATTKTDALDADVFEVRPTITSPLTNEDALLCLDKKVRTGLKRDPGTPLQVMLEMNPAVSYDAAVLVFQDATAWSVQPTGPSGSFDPIDPVTGTVITPPSRQFFYTDFERTVNDVEVTGVSGSTGLTVILSNGGTLQEIYLLKKEFEVPSVDRPVRYRNFGLDPGAQGYRTEDGSLISYAGLSLWGKVDLHIGWDYVGRELKKWTGSGDSRQRVDDSTSKDFLKNLEDLFYGPPIRKPFFIYPQPRERPNEVFRVYWRSCIDLRNQRFTDIPGFAPYPTAASLASGYTLDVNLIET